MLLLIAPFSCQAAPASPGTEREQECEYDLNISWMSFCSRCSSASWSLPRLPSTLSSLRLGGSTCYTRLTRLRQKAPTTTTAYRVVFDPPSALALPTLRHPNTRGLHLANGYNKQRQHTQLFTKHTEKNSSVHRAPALLL